MADDIDSLKKRSIFPAARYMLNSIIRDNSPDSGNPHRGAEGEHNAFGKSFRKPTLIEAQYVKSMCEFLHYECGLGNPNDPTDTVARIARYGSVEKMLQDYGSRDTYNLRPRMQVREDFFELANLMFFNSDFGGRHAWIDEKIQPEKLLKMLAIHTHYLRALKPERDASVRPDHQFDYLYESFVDVPENKELFHSVQDSALEHLPLTEKNQKFVRDTSIEDDSRAKVIYFGGMIQASEQPEFVNRAMRRIKRVLGSPGEVPTSDYDIYVVTYNNRAQMAKSQNILHHTLDPEHFSSQTAKDVVRDYLRPVYSAHDYPLDEAQLMKNMSLLTFVGYSYGSNFIQEVRNAMMEDMSVFYQPEVVKEALSHVAAFNLSSVATIADKSERGDFTQIHSAAYGDSATFLHSNIDMLMVGDTNERIKQFRREDENGLHTLVMEGYGMPETVLSCRTDDIGLEDAGFTDARGGKITVRALSTAAARPDPAGHHIESNLGVDQIRPDDNELILMNNPTASVIMPAMREAVKASVAVAKGNMESRDTPQIIAAVAAEKLAPEAIMETAMGASRLRAQVELAITRGEIGKSRPRSS